MKRKPKVMHIITRLDMGGSAQNTLLTCLGLSAKYDLTLLHGLSRESQMTDREKEIVSSQRHTAVKKGVTVAPVSALVRKIDPLRDVRAFWAIHKRIARDKPDIVHTHSSKAGIIGRLAARLSAVPTIIHTPHGHVFFGHFGSFLSRLFLLIEKVFDRITDCQVALTEGEKNDYLKLGVSRDSKLVTIHSGVDIEKFRDARVDANAKKKALGLTPSGAVVGTIGWLLPIKGPEYLLEAMTEVWKNFPDVQLVYAGKGDLEKKLRQKALQTGASDKIYFLGWRDDIPELMQIFDVFVLPSLNEGMGRVVVEAMAAGRPVVATRVGGLTDLVDHGRNGFLVRPADSVALAEAIHKLLKSPGLRLEMGEKGRSMSGGYSVDKMIEKIDNLYAGFL